MSKKEKIKVAQLSEGTLSDEELTKWQDRIGLSMRIGSVFNQNVSFEATRNFSYGIGDANPVSMDTEYAKKTKYGALVASPAWVISAFPHWVLQGLPGVHADHSASDWEFLKPIYVNDKITPKCYFVGYDVRSSAFAGKSAFEYQKFEYWNQRDELVSQGHCMLVRYERQVVKAKTAKGKGKYDSIKIPHPWTEKELEKVDQEVLAEEIRGSEPRYWEDVEVGDELPKLVKGPFGITDFISFTIGCCPVQMAAHGIQLRTYKKHPAWGFRDAVTSAWEPVYSVHYNAAAARGVGAMYAYDAGVQRHSWVVNLLTNWMGDDAWVKNCNAQYRKFVYISDVVRISGKVIKKYIDENKELCVDVETHGINQRDEDTIMGKSTVILPSKGKGAISPVEKRLPDKQYRGTGKGVYF